MSDKSDNKQIDPDILEQENDDEGHYVEVIDLDAELDQDGYYLFFWLLVLNIFFNKLNYLIAELARKLGLDINMMNEDEEEDEEYADDEDEILEEDDENFVDDSLVKIKKHDGSFICIYSIFY